MIGVAARVILVCAVSQALIPTYTRAANPLTVICPSRAPVLNSIGYKALTLGNRLSFTVSASDPDGTSLRLSIAGLPSGASFNSDTGLFQWTPRSAGTYTIDFTAANHCLAQTQSVEITVIAPASQSTPVAQDDAVADDFDTPIVLDVLANDRGLQNRPLTISIAEPPLHGSAAVQADGRIIYTPDPGFLGKDDFTYRVSDADQETAEAAVTVTIECPNCITLTWDTPTEPVLGYFIYYGTTPESTDEMILDLSVDAGLFDPEQPSVRYDLAQLGDHPNQSACFRISGYAAAGESSPSDAFCIDR